MPFRDKRVKRTRAGGRTRNSVLIGIFVHCPTARQVLTSSPPAALQKSPNPIHRHSIPCPILPPPISWRFVSENHARLTFDMHVMYGRFFRVHLWWLSVNLRKSARVDCSIKQYVFTIPKKIVHTYVYVDLHKRPYCIVVRDRSLALRADTRWNTREKSPVRFVPDANSNTSDRTSIEMY